MSEKMNKRKFRNVDELLERAFLGVIKRKEMISENGLKTLFKEIGIIEETDETICWECWGKAILDDLVKKGLVMVVTVGFSEKSYALTEKGCDIFKASEREQEIRDEE